MPNSWLSLQQAVENRRPQRGVDHRDRFVGDDQARSQQERPGDHDALPLTAAQLVRVAAQCLRGRSPTAGQRLVHQRSPLLA